MITVLQETTVWDKAQVANGIYHLNDSGYLVAFKGVNSELKTFKNPLKNFSKARRKFVVLDTYEDEAENDGLTRIKFTGSKGNTYVVTVQDGDARCNCPGFTFRGKCKHSDEIRGKIAEGVDF